MTSTEIKKTIDLIRGVLDRRVSFWSNHFTYTCMPCQWGLANHSDEWIEYIPPCA